MAFARKAKGDRAGLGIRMQAFPVVDATLARCIAGASRADTKREFHRTGGGVPTLVSAMATDANRMTAVPSTAVALVAGDWRFPQSTPAQ